MSEFVSMPSTGFYPFLLSSGSAIAAPSKECQCPQRASIHFYIQYTRKIILWRDVSMPSTGFYPFLQIKSEIDSKKESNCVNALNGLLSISTYYLITYNKKLECVNALNGLLSISTGGKQPERNSCRLCQCPQRASIHFYFT